MLERLLQVGKNVAGRIAFSLKRFPEPLVFAFVTVLILIYLNHNHTQPAADNLLRVAMTLALGVPLTLCLRMMGERGTGPKVPAILAYGLAILFLFGYYHFLLPDQNMVSMTRYMALNLAFYLFFIAIPYWGRNRGFEHYVLELGMGFAATYFYSLALFAGLAAILFTINALFSAGIPGEVYLDLFLVVAGIFAPAYFLAGIPAYGVEYKREDYPKFFQILLLYIVMPLLTVYTAILYVYFFKIIITRYWPEGIVSHLVLWYSLVSIAVIFSIYPLKERNQWVRVFVACFPKLILPLLLMLFLAMGIRIRAYGVTENRYLVLAGGLWTTGMMLYYALKKDNRNVTIVLSAAIITVLVVSGPWSAYAVSKHSQNIQLEKLLTKNGMIVAGNIVPSPEIPQADKERISSIINYFHNNHSLADLELLPPGFTLAQMEEVFGFDLTFGTWDRYFRYHLEGTGLLDVSEYDYYLPVVAGHQDSMEVKEGGLTIFYAAPVLKIEREGQIIYEKNIEEVALAIHAAHEGEVVLDKEEMTFVEENEHLRIMFLFQHIDGMEEEGLPQIQWMELAVLVKVF
ncbi:MAG TPA: DUF4153 domain-containing protein [Firmicutes bacterium]|nr:DUF4153 domain-containing protein [Bacillota bacterium]